MGPMVNDCEAGSNIWRDITKIISSANNNAKSSSRQRTDPNPKEVEFTLDGSYSRIQFASNVYQKE